MTIIFRKTSTPNAAQSKPTNAKAAAVIPAKQPSHPGIKKTHDHPLEIKRSSAVYEEKYKRFAEQLRNLIAALTEKKKCMNQSRKADQEIQRQLSLWACGTPVADIVCNKKSTSYESVQVALDISRQNQEDRFEKALLDYVVEWEKLASLKLTMELKQFKENKQELDEIEKQMTKLCETRDRILARGKTLSSKKEEKINSTSLILEDKRHAFEKHESSLHQSVENLIEQSWRDLCPLLRELLQINIISFEERAVIQIEVADLAGKLSSLAERNGLPKEGRNASELWRSLQLQPHIPYDDHSSAKERCNETTQEKSHLPITGETDKADSCVAKETAGALTSSEAPKGKDDCSCADESMARESRKSEIAC